VKRLDRRQWKVKEGWSELADAPQPLKGTVSTRSITGLSRQGADQAIWPRAGVVNVAGWFMAFGSSRSRAAAGPSSSQVSSAAGVEWLRLAKRSDRGRCEVLDVPAAASTVARPPVTASRAAVTQADQKVWINFAEGTAASNSGAAIVLKGPSRISGAGRFRHSLRVDQCPANHRPGGCGMLFPEPLAIHVSTPAPRRATHRHEARPIDQPPGNRCVDPGSAFVPAADQRVNASLNLPWHGSQLNWLMRR